MAWNNDTTPTGIVTGISRATQTVYKTSFFYGTSFYRLHVKAHITVTTTEYRGLTEARANAIAASFNSTNVSTYTVNWAPVSGIYHNGRFEVEASTTSEVRRANEAGGYTVVVTSQSFTLSAASNSSTAPTITEV